MKVHIMTKEVLPKIKSKIFRVQLLILTKHYKLNLKIIKAYYGRGFSKTKLNDQRGAVMDLTKAIEIKNLYVSDPKKIVYEGKITKSYWTNYVIR